MKKIYFIFFFIISSLFSIAQISILKTATIIEKQNFNQYVVTKNHTETTSGSTNLVTKYLIMDNVTKEVLIALSINLNVLVGSQVIYVAESKIKDINYQGASIVVSN